MKSREQSTAADRWNYLEAERQSYYDNCLFYASVGARRLLTRDELDRANYTRNQSFVARGVATLANSINETLFPATRPAFTLIGKTDVLRDLEPEHRDIFNRALSEASEETIEVLRGGAYSEAALRIIENTMVFGSSVFKLKDKKPTVYNLSDFMLKRDADANVIEFLLSEFVSAGIYDTLVNDYGLSAEVITKAQGTALKENRENNARVYTWCVLEGNKWNVKQYLEDAETPFSIDKPGVNTFPFYFADWNKIRGSDYGEGLIEQHIADINAFDLYAAALTKSGIASMDYRNLVHPNSGVDVEHMNQAKVGSYVAGDPEAIKTFHGGPDAKSVAEVRQHYQILKRDLSAIFLLKDGIVRDSERTTAEEIRNVSKALETQLSGVYMRFFTDVQKPLILDAIKGTGVSKIDADIHINTGTSALARFTELNNMRAFLNDALLFSQIVTNLPGIFNKHSTIAELAMDNDVPQHKVLNSLADVKASEQQQDDIDLAGAFPEQPQASQ